jgi:hypothetical protein
MTATIGDIALACINCHDGATNYRSIPAGWIGVEYGGEITDDESDMRWWTHIGWCADCIRDYPWQCEVEEDSEPQIVQDELFE